MRNFVFALIFLGISGVIFGAVALSDKELVSISNIYGCDEYWTLTYHGLEEDTIWAFRDIDEVITHLGNSGKICNVYVMYG